MMDAGATDKTAFNLILCYYTLGDKERMKKGFQKLLSIKPNGIDKFEELMASRSADEPLEDHEVFSQDSLRALSLEK
jgi:intraflagellar transport protein 88